MMYLMYTGEMGKMNHISSTYECVQFINVIVPAPSDRGQHEVEMRFMRRKQREKA